jgi:hypothetical protein
MYYNKSYAKSYVNLISKYLTILCSGQRDDSYPRQKGLNRRVREFIMPVRMACNLNFMNFSFLEFST